MMSDSAERKPGLLRIYNSITETIGDTPLVRLPNFAREKKIVADLTLDREMLQDVIRRKL